MKIDFFLLGFAALSLVACKREQVSHSNPHKALALSTTPTAVVGPENPLNPCDSVGTWHNRIPDSLKAYILNGQRRGGRQSGSHLYHWPFVHFCPSNYGY